MRKATRNSELLRKRKLHLYAGLYRKTIIWLVAGFLLFGVFLFKDRLFKQVKESFIEYSSYAGFKLKNLVIAGCKNIDVKELLSKMDADNNTPIFAIELQEIKNSLEQSDWVEQALVARQLPNTIKISILERKPIAIWQYNKELFLVDLEGYKIRSDISKFTDLPMVVGQGANYYAATLLAKLAQKKAIESSLSSASLIGNRRWDLNLKSGAIIKLPENNIDKALDYLEEQINNKIDLNKLKVLDLRDDEKYYLEKN